LKRSWLGYLAILVVATIGVAAGVDAVITRDGEEHADDRGAGRNTSATRPPVTTRPVLLDPCRPGQLALAIGRLSGTAVVELTHLRGEPCLVRRVKIDLRVRARDGQPVARLVFDGSGRFAGEIGPDLSFIAAFTFLPRCGQRGPFLASATLTSYSARRELPDPRACVTHA
jgi:hypothetical protein